MASINAKNITVRSCLFLTLVMAVIFSLNLLEITSCSVGQSGNCIKDSITVFGIGLISQPNLTK